MTTLQVNCKCGKKLRAKAELAGKRVKCPACGSSVQIPTVQGTTTVAAKKAPKANDKPTNRPDPVADLLDEIGFVAARSRNSCPRCKTTLAADAVLCVHCGYHLEKGKSLQTKRVGRL